MRYAVLMATVTYILGSTVAQAAPSQAALKLLEENYRPQISVKESSPERTTRYCGKSTIQITGADPVSLESRLVTVVDYRPSQSKSFSDLKTIILMPPTGGENSLDRDYAEALCDAGFRVALVQQWAYDTFKELDLGMHDRGSIRMVAAVKHVIEWLKPQRPQQLGILGTSVGGISASLILGYERRVSAGFLIVAGAGMSHIIANSIEAGLSKLRDDRLKKFNLASVEEYEAALAPNIRIDPMDFVGYSGPKDIFMVIAESDKTVATSTQEDLWEAYGRPQNMRYDANHMWTIIRMATFQKRKVIDFFERTLK